MKKERNPDLVEINKLEIEETLHDYKRVADTKDCKFDIEVIRQKFDEDIEKRKASIEMGITQAEMKRNSSANAFEEMQGTKNHDVDNVKLMQE